MEKSLPNDFGILYLNAGTGCLARLLVSIRTLRRNYSGMLGIYSIGRDSHEVCHKIAMKYGALLKQVDYVVPEGNNRVLLEKVKLLETSPFDQTLYIDSDTIIRQPLKPKLIELLDQVGNGDFAVTPFTNWKASQGIIRRRVKGWSSPQDKMLVDGIDWESPAINTGVYFFKKNISWAKQWYELALRGRAGFISDEVGLQLLIQHVPHTLMSASWNHSCRYGIEPENAIIWHYHGRKHCRRDLAWGGDVWMAEFTKAMEENDCGVSLWTPGTDRMLRRYLRAHPFPKEFRAGQAANVVVPPVPLKIIIPDVPVKKPEPQPAAQPLLDRQVSVPSRPPVAPTVPTAPSTPTPAPASLPAGISMNISDNRNLRHCRDRYKGFRIGIEIQTPPVLFTRDGHNAWLGDMYRGGSAFLVCGGPSLKQMPLELLGRRGVLTYTINNAVSVVRSNIWSCVDDPGHFVDVMWRDPAIMKLIPLDHMDKHFHVRNANGELAPSNEKVGDMPNVFGFRRNENFVPEQYLWESTVNWGNHSQWKDQDGFTGARSIMLAAVRLLYYLGVRTVYLLGCDFKMEVGQQNYAFEQDRTAGSVKGNNYTYMVLNKRFDRLKPIFDAEGYRVFNCTPNSGLQSFPYKDFREAVEEATASIPKQIVTAGMYESSANKKKEQQQPGAPK